MEEIPLDLSRHCVETEAKIAYEKMLKQAMKTGGEGPAAEAVERLREFLETADFAALRAADPVLAGKTGGAAVLGTVSGGFVVRVGEREFPVPRIRRG
ncbi:MAG: hypothetical protein JRI97_12015 [Deltaproteobacteria bacterium]|nr:hypothetical protein [Deltaproteobacteria bacterium]